MLKAMHALFLVISLVLSTLAVAGQNSTSAPAYCPEFGIAHVCTSYYTYQVVSGDSLAKIALYAYKDENRWKIIYEANKDLLGPNPHDPRALRAGMELFIPSR